MYIASMLFLSRVNKPTAFFLLLSVFTLISIIGYDSDSDYSVSPAYARPTVSPEGPTLNDPNLIVQTVYQGLASPTAMAFLGPDDILVLDKSQGTVQRIVNGKMLPEPLLQVDVASSDERGLLGIAIASKEEDDEEEQEDEEGKNGEDATMTTTTETTTESGFSSLSTYVFLFFTEAGQSKDGTPAGNRVYKYELVDDGTKLA